MRLDLEEFRAGAREESDALVIPLALAAGVLIVFALVELASMALGH